MNMWMRATGAVAMTIGCHATVWAEGLQATVDPLKKAALQAPRASHSVMLAVASAGSRIVAAGERGIVLRSEDGGKSWQQARVPVSVTLTGLAFPITDQGWAVGHGGVVLHTSDGGKTWSRQLDGRTLAQLELKAARAAGDARRVALAEQLVGDGPDKPLLAVHFWDEQRGFAIGAYGLIIGTEDGGNTWESWMGRVENPRRLHLNAFCIAGRNIYLVGEQGLILRSQDDGRGFQRLDTPYKGSWFAVGAQRDQLVIAGLRGNVFTSNDEGATWHAAEVPVPTTIAAMVIGADGSSVFVNQAGMLLSSKDRGRTLQTMQRPTGPAVTALAYAQDGGLWAASFAGVMRLPLNGSLQGVAAQDIRHP